MSQHLEDRVLTDLVFDLLDAKEAAAAKRHLQGCRACKARQKTLRATIGQLDATKKDFTASEELIARTLRATPSEKTAPVKAPAKLEIVPPSVETQPEETPAMTDNILDLPPRKSVLEMQRFFWVAIAASLVVAGIVGVTTFTQKQNPAAVAQAKNEVQSKGKSKLLVASGGSIAAEPEKREARQTPVGSLNRALADARRDELKKTDSVANDVVLEKAMIAPAAAQPPPVVAARALSAPVATPAPAKPTADDAARLRVTKPSAPAPAPASPAATVQLAKSRSSSEVSPVAFVATADVAPAAMPVAEGLAAPADRRRSGAADELAFTVQTISFVQPLTSGTWVLQQNVRVRASVSDDEARLDVSNHGALPVLFQLMPRRGTNVLRQFELDAGAATNFIQRMR